MGATHGSSLANPKSAPPAALAALLSAPRAPSLVAPATIVAAPAATVTAAVASTPEMPTPLASSSLERPFFFNASGSTCKSDADAALELPQPIFSLGDAVGREACGRERPKTRARCGSNRGKRKERWSPPLEAPQRPRARATEFVMRSCCRPKAHLSIRVDKSSH